MTRAELELFLELYDKARRGIEKQLVKEYSNTSLKDFTIQGNRLIINFASGATFKKSVRTLCDEEATENEAQIKLDSTAISAVKLKQKELNKIITELQRINDNLDKFIE